MKRILLTTLLATLLLLGAQAKKNAQTFVRVEGRNLVQPNGQQLFIVGTNLGNWLNPEGYMFGFTRTNSPWMIDQMICQLVGTDLAADFWQQFKDNYITEADLRFIAQTGANTVRLPFNYKLFTAESYMGLSRADEGFRIIDQVVGWCRQNGLYLILDMHDCPNGQTGDNIDNGYGYPWLFYSERSQQLFIDIWTQIASRYKNEPIILGYELMNEPIAHYFSDKEEINTRLEPLYKRAVEAIRKIDRNHVILLGGAQWNSNFEPFSDWTFDNNIMYTCHRYGGGASKEAIQSFIDFRDRTNLPMYMGEIGHNTTEWQAQFVEVMRQNNIGYTFWPYKKLDGECMVAIEKPEEWDSLVVRFAESSRQTYDEIRAHRPDQQRVQQVLRAYLSNLKFQNCRVQRDYVRSMGLQAE